MVSVHDLTVFAQITSIPRCRGATLIAIDLQVCINLRIINYQPCSIVFYWIYVLKINVERGIKKTYLQVQNVRLQGRIGPEKFQLYQIQNGRNKMAHL